MRHRKKTSSAGTLSQNDLKVETLCVRVWILQGAYSMVPVHCMLYETSRNATWYLEDSTYVRGKNGDAPITMLDYPKSSDHETSTFVLPLLRAYCKHDELLL